MFTGIIETTGRVVWCRKKGRSGALCVALPGRRRLELGQSLAVNGVCLTVAGFEKRQPVFDLLEVTLANTNLGLCRAGDRVNIERPLRMRDEWGGHFVTGHVDAVVKVKSFRRGGDGHGLMALSVPFRLRPYIAPKGSVALDGVSLTVVDLTRDGFRVALIPHTLSATNLGWRQEGDWLNLEVDLLARYVARLLSHPIGKEDGSLEQNP